MTKESLQSNINFCYAEKHVIVIASTLSLSTLKLAIQDVILAYDIKTLEIKCSPQWKILLETMLWGDDFNYLGRRIKLVADNIFQGTISNIFGHREKIECLFFDEEKSLPVCYITENENQLK